jgi:demethylmenaquinone methyltransferase/2-methoxy-6-polyprenyl-1,4-benzoquinol methylase
MTEREYRGPDSRRVQEMFGAIAPRYDFLNHFLSASIDRRWRRLAVRKVQELTRSSPPRLCLDVCSGTGDLALALHRAFGCDVIASDFSHPMLTRAKAKVSGRPIRNVEADALHLPFADASFDVLTVAFGLRNLEDPLSGLKEMRRVLQPGGLGLILEFSKPVVPVFRGAFNFYFRRILPKLGNLISGDATAYQYLPDSVKHFFTQGQLVELLHSAGFSNAAYRNLSGGIAALHWAQKAGISRDAGQCQ